MKNITTLLLLFFALSLGAQCPNGFITFYSQSDIEEFVAEYPDCTHLEGRLTITDGTQTQITDLSLLSQLEAIGVGLRIRNTSALTNLSGLQNIRNIDGDLEIDGNEALLHESSFLDGLEEVSGTVVIRENASFTKLPEFSSLVRIGEKLVVTFNNSITELRGFDVLQEIGDDLDIMGNDSLIHTNGFLTLQSINGDFDISSNSLLREIIGFNALQEVKGNIRWPHNFSLDKIDGFNGLDSLNQSIEISPLSEIRTLMGFNNLKYLGGDFQLDGCPNLDTVDGFNNLQVIDGSLDLYNVEMTKITDFDSLSDIKKVLSILNCEIEGVPEFSSLVSTGLGIVILGNSTLKNIVGFNSLMSSQGGILISDNISLEYIEGFESLISHDFKIEISDNEVLQSVLGFSNLEQVDELIVENNRNLVTIPQFPELKIVNKVLEFKYLNNVTSILGFNKLENAGTISISNNTGLIKIDGFTNLISASLIIAEHSQLDSISGFDQWEKGSLGLGNNSNLTYFNDLTALDSVSFVTIAKNDILTIAPDMPNLSYIEGDLRISNNESLEEIPEFPNLLFIGDNVNFENNPLVSTINTLHNVRSIGGKLYISAGISSKPKVKTIFLGKECLDIGGVEIRWLDSLESFVGLNELKESGRIEFSFCHFLTDLDAFDELENVFGEFELSLTGLKTLNGINNLDSVSGNFSLHLKIVENIDAFRSLKYVGRTFYLNSDSLENMDSFEQLSSVGEDFDMSFNDKLNSIANMPLEEIRGRIFLFQNPELNDISGLRFFDPTLIKEDSQGLALIIRSNPNLEMCNIESICEVIRIGEKGVRIEDNAPGCNSEIEIDCSKGFAEGLVFFDSNGNGLLDSDEKGISNMVIEIPTEDYSIYTNAEGEFLASNQEIDPIEISLSLPPAWQLSTDSMSYILDNNFMREYPFLFGVIPGEESREAILNLSSDPTRCNTNINAKIRYESRSSITEATRLELHLDPEVNMVSASIDPINQQGQVISWEFTNQPFEVSDIDLILQMPDEQSTGLQLQFDVRLYSVSTNELINEYSYNPTVLCSYDPNDKLVMPPGVQENNYTLFDEKLTYTIRFQNTGNAEAIDIEIRDTIDTNLDLSTFKVVNTSHPVYTAIRDRAVSFLFENIYLPDSTNNEPESHGFITYEIIPLKDLDENTAVNNTASIYFDFNPPIVTNTTLNTYVSKIPTVSTSNAETDELFVFPNPSTGIINVRHSEEIRRIRLLDVSGKVVAQSFEDFIDVSELSPGIYMLEVNSANRIQYCKVIRS